MLRRMPRARATVMATSALLPFSGAAHAAPHDKPVRATGQDCAVVAAVFGNADSLARLKSLLAGPIGYGPLNASRFKDAFPELTDAEAADLAEGSPKAEGKRFTLGCNWRKLGFSLGERWLYHQDFPWSRVSRPVIGASGLIAYVSTYAQFASLGGEGRDCLLRKTNGAWKVETCRFDGLVS